MKRRTDGLSLAERLLHYSTVASNGCREWTGDLDGHGYGRLWWKGRSRRAHRLALELILGASIPSGKMACHTCDNRKCIEAGHLYAGSPKQNTEDMLRRGRVASGEKNGNSKLTIADIYAIRTDARAQAKIAKDFGLAQSTVGRIKLGRTWGSV